MNGRRRAAISNNTHLENVRLSNGALNDTKMSFLFRGLTSSNAIKYKQLYSNELRIEGVRSMVPSLTNSNNLKLLDLDGNNIQSGGFDVIFGNCVIAQLKICTVQ